MLRNRNLSKSTNQTKQRSLSCPSLTSITLILSLPKKKNTQLHLLYPWERKKEREKKHELLQPATSGRRASGTRLWKRCLSSTRISSSGISPTGIPSSRWLPSSRRLPSSRLRPARLSAAAAARQKTNRFRGRLLGCTLLLLSSGRLFLRFTGISSYHVVFVHVIWKLIRINGYVNWLDSLVDQSTMIICLCM